MVERERKEKEEKERNRKENSKIRQFEGGESDDDLPQFSNDIAKSMRKDRKQRRSHEKNRVAGKCGSGKKTI
jgi:hypothetical protein